MLIPDLANKLDIPSSITSAPSNGFVTAITVSGKGNMFFVEGFDPVGNGFVPVKQGDSFSFGQYYSTGVGVFYPARSFD